MLQDPKPEIARTIHTTETADLPADLPHAPAACCVLPPSLRLAPQEAEQLAAMFKALGHPVRLQIVELLSRFGGQVCVCDVEGQFDLSQPTISHHLKILREAGLVAAEQRGLWVFYFVQPAALAQLRGVLGGVLGGALGSEG